MRFPSRTDQLQRAFGNARKRDENGGSPSRLIPPPTEAAKELGAEADEKVWEVVRSRRIDGEHIILDKDYFVKNTCLY